DVGDGIYIFVFFFQAEDGIRDRNVTGVQTCALPILRDVTGATLAAVNAGRTRHSGAELGLSGELTDRLTGRLAWTWQDFRFDGEIGRASCRERVKILGVTVWIESKQVKHSRESDKMI